MSPRTWKKRNSVFNLCMSAAVFGTLLPSLALAQDVGVAQKTSSSSISRPEVKATSLSDPLKPLQSPSKFDLEIVLKYRNKEQAMTHSNSGHGCPTPELSSVKRRRNGKSDLVYLCKKPNSKFGDEILVNIVDLYSGNPRLVSTGTRDGKIKQPEGTFLISPDHQKGTLIEHRRPTSREKYLNEIRELQIEAMLPLLSPEAQKRFQEGDPDGRRLTYFRVGNEVIEIDHSSPLTDALDRKLQRELWQFDQREQLNYFNNRIQSNQSEREQILKQIKNADLDTKMRLAERLNALDRSTEKLEKEQVQTSETKGVTQLDRTPNFVFKAKLFQDGRETYIVCESYMDLWELKLAREGELSPPSEKELNDPCDCECEGLNHSPLNLEQFRKEFDRETLKNLDKILKQLEDSQKDSERKGSSIYSNDGIKTISFPSREPVNSKANSSAGKLN